jgi:DNA-binding beta-propeller fold protein YncE
MCLETFAQKPEVIQTASERDLIPEGIAVDPKSGTIYVSSIARQKILAIDKKGAHKDFIKEKQWGYAEGLGLKVDRKRNLLWTLSNKKEGSIYFSRLMAFHLKTGKLVKEYIHQDTAKRLFNDLVIDSKGTIYFTDTYYGTVYSVQMSQNNIEVFAREKELMYPNGITIGQTGQLYVATYSNGPVRIDPVTKQVSRLKGFKDTTIAYMLDGLMYWNNSLIGIYNVAKDNSGNAVVQYFLNEKGDEIIDEKIIEKGNPYFKEPTTAAIVNNTLYVLANSHLGNYNANKESTRGIEEQLTPVVILKYRLK